MNLHSNIKSTSESKDSDVLFLASWMLSRMSESDFSYRPSHQSPVPTPYSLLIELRHSIDEVGGILDAGRLIGGVHGELGEADVYGRHGDDGV